MSSLTPAEKKLWEDRAAERRARAPAEELTAVTRLSDREYNALTTDLDVAIRLLNRAIQHEKRARYGHADIDRIRAARVLESIGPEKLIIGPELS